MAPDKLTVTRHCSGGCGTPVSYFLESGWIEYAPSLLLSNAVSSVAYKGGHLCQACTLFVASALQARNECEPEDHIALVVVPEDNMPTAEKGKTAIERLLYHLQDALDHGWPYARMGSVKALWARKVRP